MKQDCSVESYLRSPADRRFRIRIVRETDSTSGELKREAGNGAPDGLVLIADRQSRGVGRLERPFFSPEGSGLYLSLLLRTPMPAQVLPSVTVSAAVAAAEAAEAVAGEFGEKLRIGIKWVNDLWLDGRKICGILAESRLGQDGSADWTVLGIGMNLFPPAGGFPDWIRDTAGSLFPAEIPGIRNRIAGEFLNRLGNYLEKLPETCPMSSYRSRSILDGKRIRVAPVSREGETIPALALGIGPDGGLAVRFEDGSETVLHVGEVTRIIREQENEEENR